MTKRSRTIAALALAGALAAFSPQAARAQVAGSATMPTSEGQLKMIALGYRASKLLKANVYDVDGKKIGEVEDFVVTQNSAVSFVILEVGGFLHIGQKEVAVPARSFRIINKKVVLPGVTANDLKALPAFKWSTL